LFLRAGGYPAQSGAVDQAFEAAVARAQLDAAESTALAPAENYYVYRWGGTGSYHLSALGRDDTDGEAGYAAAEAFVDAELAAGRLAPGEVLLRPAWRQEYLDLAGAYLVDLAAHPGQASEVDTTAAEAPPVDFGRLPRPVPAGEALALFRATSPLRVSVVLPSCNEAAYLQRTVEQFRATLPGRSEIVVVDNGSTDGSSDFLLNGTVQPADGQPRLVEAGDGPDGVAISLVRHAEPLGVAGARNRGLELTRGEVIVFADAHVDVPPGWWPPLVATLNRPAVGIVGPSFGIIGATNQGTSHGQRIADTKLRVEWLPRRSESEEPYPVPTLGGGFLALRREVVEVSGGFDGSMRQWGSEDLELCLRLWLFGYEAWVVPEVEIPHYFRKQSPYEVDWKNAIQNLIRTAFLHLNQERLTRFLHAMSDHPQYARALALCVESDVWWRRHELRRRRVHDDDWYFHHPYFADIEMELRQAAPA
jgi:glycosyltransferase involved in cell wall biosynthesis